MWPEKQRNKLSLVGKVIVNNDYAGSGGVCIHEFTGQEWKE